MHVLDPSKRYFQIAFNYDIGLAEGIIPTLPRDDRIIIEAGTPFIKRYGEAGIRRIASLWPGIVVADIKTVDGAEQEVQEAYSAGASAATVIGTASKETIDLFIKTCDDLKMDSMVDLLNVERVMKVLWPLKKPPSVAVIHRGRDEESSFGALIKYKQIVKIKGKYDVMISAAGGVDLREAQSAMFNGAEIVVANLVRPGDPWAGIPTNSNIAEMAQRFLDSIR
ncbi:MAG: hypothetical protein QGI60_04640 [archaeon]|jgi:bifunctional enzyme Fae/Hps|nr:hypothetical protein [archaeon]